MSAPSEANGLLEHLVFEIAEGVSGQTGEAFFRSLARHLAAALKADFVLIGALQPDADRLTTLAAYGDGADAPVWERDRDLMLAKLGAQDYVGSPLIDSSGRCLGLVCALTRQPLQHPKLAETVLQMFAIRAAGELERKNYEDALADSEKRLRALVSHGVEAVLRIEFEQPVSLDLPEDKQIELMYRYGYVADCNDQAARLFGRAKTGDLIGARMDVVSPPGDSDQTERLRLGIRSQWQLSQVERIVNGRPFLMTRQGELENGSLTGGWVTMRDLTGIKQAEAEVLRLNSELEQRIAELTQLKGRLERDNAYLLEEIKADHNNHEMIGSSPKFRELLDRVRLVAGTSATVLITGETGTGKELVARAIHNLSPRKDRPLVKVNCAAISAGLWKVSCLAT